MKKMTHYLRILMPTILLVPALIFLSCDSENGVIPGGGGGSDQGTEWSKTFGGPDEEEVYCLEETADGGYAMAGFSRSNGEGDQDVYIVKVGNGGELGWESFVGGAQDDAAFGLYVNGGTYLAAGYTYSDTYGSADAWLGMVNEDAISVWDNHYGSEYIDFAHSIVDGVSGDLILGVNLNGDSLGIVATNTSGTELWKKNYGQGTAFKLIRTPDHYYMLGGYVGTPETGTDAVLIKIDSAGDEVWRQTYGNTDNDRIDNFAPATGGYIFTGTIFDLGPENEMENIFLGKVDPEGTLLWEKSLGGQQDQNGRAVIETRDGGYLVVGMTETTSTEGYVVKTDSSGTPEWNRTFGGDADDGFWDVKETLSGSYLIAGYTNSEGSGLSDAWLVHILSEPPEPEED
ncbi:hypothetical protein K8I28_16060 [bacterium]|nr:hypothetical protein [bacterium]